MRHALFGIHAEMDRQGFPKADDGEEIVVTDAATGEETAITLPTKAERQWDEVTVTVRFACRSSGLADRSGLSDLLSLTLSFALLLSISPLRYAFCTFLREPSRLTYLGASWRTLSRLLLL